MAILERRNNEVSISGRTQEQQFSIAAVPEMFEILSDRIYPNKVKAVVRELSTNAVDATIDARKVSKLHKLFATTPYSSLEQCADKISENIEYVENEWNLWSRRDDNGTVTQYDLRNWTERAPLIHLPNRIEPWFSVRDYGTGVAHEFIMKMYTQYGWSNKRTSNDYTGCLGLGSKSPFAYTDHFVVTSYFNGEKRMYNAHLTDGFPAIVIFQDDDGNDLVYPTDEPNGLEVQFSVRASDFTEFADEAKRLYPYFKLPLEIVGNSEVKLYLAGIQKSKELGTHYSVSNDKSVHWGFRKDSEVSGPMAVMGNIAYPISLQDSYKLSQVSQRLLASDIDIQFPVGSLQITPSREQLSYKKSTIEAIHVALESIEKELAEKINDKISSAPSLWEARCLAGDLFHRGDFEGFASILNLGKLKWQDQEIGATIHINFVDDDENKHGVIIHKFDPTPSRKQRIRSVTTQVPVSRELVIYENDLPRGSFTRMEIACVTQRKVMLMLEFTSAAAKAAFIEKLGMEPGTTFPLTSTLEKPTPQARASYSSDAHIFKYDDGEDTTPSRSYYRRRQYQERRQYKYWNKVDGTFTLSDGGIYVEMLRYKIIGNDNVELHPKTVGGLYELLTKLNISKPDLIGVRRKMVKQFVRSDDWVDLITYCRNQLKIEVSTNNLGVNLANLKALREVPKYERWVAMSSMHKRLNNGKLKTFLEKIAILNDSYVAVFEKESNYVDLATKVGFKFEDKATYEIKDDTHELLMTYPMLQFVIDSYHNATSPQLVDYINAIDK